VYLQTGNMNDIKKMKLDDFRCVIEQLIRSRTPNENRYKSELSDSQKNMIAYHKNKFQKDGKVK